MFGQLSIELFKPAWGLVELADPETGRRRVVLMRPSLRRAWIARQAERRRAVASLLQRHARRPFLLVDRLDADRLGRHLLEG